MSSLLLSFGLSSKAPNPMVLILPVPEKVAKSAKLVSTFKTAAFPLELSAPERRNSLNQTSPQIGAL